jgi:hypothetical protein
VRSSWIPVAITTISAQRSCVEAADAGLEVLPLRRAQPAGRVPARTGAR